MLDFNMQDFSLRSKFSGCFDFTYLNNPDFERQILEQIWQWYYPDFFADSKFSTTEFTSDNISVSFFDISSSINNFKVIWH